MTKFIRCDGCGAESDEGDFFDISRYSEGWSAHGDFCEDCLPDEILEDMETEEHNV